MNETPLFAQNRFIFFLSRLFILAGMVLVFAGLASLAGFFVLMPFGIDIFKNFDVYISNPDYYKKEINLIKLFQVFASIGTFLIPALLFPKAIGKTAISFLQINKKSHWQIYLISAFTILLALPLVSYIYELNKGFSFPEQWNHFEVYLKEMEDRAEKITKALTATNTISDIIINTFIIAIIPAIAEEFFFRGCLQNFVKMVFYNIHISIIFSAIIFSGFHGQFYGFLPRMALGMVLGYLFAYSNNIWVPVLGHFINNFFALLSIYLYKLNPQWEFLSEDYSFPLFIIIISSVLCIALIFILSHLRFRHLQAHE